MKWYLFLIFGVCCISTSAILVTLAGVPPTQGAFYRNVFGALLWLAAYPVVRPFAPLARKKGAELPCRFTWLAPLVARLNPTRIFLGLGFFFAIDLWAWHRAIVYIGAGPATLMGNLQVVFVALLAFFLFGDHLKRMFWPGVLLALVGIGMLTLTNPLGSNVVLGVVCGILTALTYSIFIIFLKYLEPYQVTAQQTLFWVAALTALFLLLPTLLEDGLLLPGVRPAAILLLHALISSVVGWWVIVTVLKKVPVAAASTLLLMQPLLTSIWGHLFLGQGLVGVQVAGICLALFGIRLANWGT